MNESSEELAYRRGKLDATVAEHSKHLERINGSLETISKQMAAAAHAMTIAAEKAASRDAIAVHTAQVAKDMRQQAIDKSEAHWRPWQRIFAAIAGVSALVAIAIAVARWMKT